MVVQTNVMSGICAGCIVVFWSSHSDAMDSASGRDGTERGIPSGVFMVRPSSDIPYHVHVDVDVDVPCLGVRDVFMENRDGFSRDMFDADWVPSTPAEIGLSMEELLSLSLPFGKWSHGGDVGTTSTTL